MYDITLFQSELEALSNVLTFSVWPYQIDGIVFFGYFVIILKFFSEDGFYVLADEQLWKMFGHSSH